MYVMQLCPHFPHLLFLFASGGGPAGDLEQLVELYFGKSSFFAIAVPKEDSGIHKTPVTYLGPSMGGKPRPNRPNN